MKISTYLFPAISIIYLLILSSCDVKEKPEIQIKDQKKEAVTNLPLIYQMAYFNRFSEKLYFAGEAENWELADIYTHELEEVAEVIIDAEDIDDGINRSQLMEDMFVPQIEEMEKAIDAQDRDLFRERYQALVNTCNSCHTAANYGAIKITTPKENQYNQDFSKIE